MAASKILPKRNEVICMLMNLRISWMSFHQLLTMSSQSQTFLSHSFDNALRTSSAWVMSEGTTNLILAFQIENLESWEVIFIKNVLLCHFIVIVENGISFYISFRASEKKSRQRDFDFLQIQTCEQDWCDEVFSLTFVVRPLKLHDDWRVNELVIKSSGA